MRIHRVKVGVRNIMIFINPHKKTISAGDIIKVPSMNKLYRVKDADKYNENLGVISPTTQDIKHINKRHVRHADIDEIIMMLKTEYLKGMHWDYDTSDYFVYNKDYTIQISETLQSKKDSRIEEVADVWRRKQRRSLDDGFRYVNGDDWGLPSYGSIDMF